MPGTKEEPNESYDLTIVNQSTQDVGQVSLWYTGVKGPPPNFEIDVSVPAGETKTVELTLDSATNYYTMRIIDAGGPKYIEWYPSVTGDYVLLSRGGSSTCTLTDDQSTCFAGENHVNPASLYWP